MNNSISTLVSTVKPPAQSRYVSRVTFDMTEFVPVLNRIALTESNAKCSPLLRLPGEVRTKIFKHVLGGHDIMLGSTCSLHIRESSPSNIAYLTNKQKKKLLAVTLVSRQIYTETAMLPFVCNDFVFTSDSEESEKALAQRLLPAQINAIVTIKCSPDILFYGISNGVVASRYCLRTFADLEALQHLVVVDVSDMHLSDDNKSYLIEKLRKAHGKKTLQVEFSAEELIAPCVSGMQGPSNSRWRFSFG